MSTTVYPNPTSDFVQIELSGAFEYTLLSINGEVIRKGNSVDKATVNLINETPGTYLLQLTANGVVKVLSVVKQ